MVIVPNSIKKVTIKELLILLFVVFFGLCTGSLYGQETTAATQSDSLTTPFRKDRWLTGLSGTISYTNNRAQDSEEESIASQFGIDISTGKFIADRWLLGGILNLTRTSSDGAFERAAESFYIGPFVNYYLSSNSRGSLFATLSVGYALYREESTLVTPVNSRVLILEGGGIGLLAGFGYSYALSDKVIFDIGFEVDTFWIDTQREGGAIEGTISQDIILRSTAFKFGFDVILDEFFF